MTNTTRVVKGFAVTALILILFFGAIIGCQNNNGSSKFPQPETRRSSNGALETIIRVFIASNTIENMDTGEIDTVTTPTYEGGIIGPTLRVKPGDTLRFDLINDLPENPSEQRGGQFPHDPFTTNVHTHGLTVSPQGISDNVLRRMEPQTTSPVEIDIFDGHQTGTFWYHPHKHGSVSFQFFGGMSGFLIIEGGPGTLDDVAEVKAAKEILMGFQIIRTDQNGDLPFVNQAASNFSSEDGTTNGLWSTLKDSKFYVTTNGVTNPVLNMRPGEVQRWRLLNAASGLTLPVALEGHRLNVIANDGITVPDMLTLGTGEAYVMGAGNRTDVLVKAGEPGTYLLQALDPSTPRSVSPSGVDPEARTARIGFDFPDITYPVTLATIVVSGGQQNMDLPEGPLPVPTGIPSIEEMLMATPDAFRNVAFENCGQREGQADVTSRLPSCGWYFERYDADYWGGMAFTSLLMMRDADDVGLETTDPAMPLINFQKEGLFDSTKALFPDMIAGNTEEWTVLNRSFSDHVFHIHQNPFLLTHINGIPLPVPEWHDTIIVPGSSGDNRNINLNTPGSVTFRTRYKLGITGSMVMHCHILTHEDVGMMQRLDIKPAP